MLGMQAEWSAETSGSAAWIQTHSILWVTSYGIIAIATVASLYAVSYSAEVMVPVALAFVISVLLTPALEWVQRRVPMGLRVPRWLSVLAVTLLLLATCALLGWAVSLEMEVFISSGLDPLDKRADSLLNETFVWLDGYGVHVNESDRQVLYGDVEHGVTIDHLSTTLYDMGLVLREIALVLLLGICMLVFDVHALIFDGSEPYLCDIDLQLRLYVTRKAQSCMLMAVGITLLLLAFGVELPILVGVATFCLNLVPVLGGLGAALLPIPLIMLDDSLGLHTKLFVAGTSVLLQLLNLSVIEAKLYQQAVHLSTIPILISVTLFVSLWGLQGALVAVPGAIILRECLREVEHPCAQMALAVLAVGENEGARRRRQRRVHKTRLELQDMTPGELELLCEQLLIADKGNF